MKTEKEGQMQERQMREGQMQERQMHIMFATLLAAAAAVLVVLFGYRNVLAADSVDMYRMYNSESGEHLYTADYHERDVLMMHGWDYEGIGWKAPAVSSTPVYRVFNPKDGMHLYTKDSNERSELLKQGWNDEGIAFYSDDGKSIPMYREFNPAGNAASSHNFTADAHENDVLTKEHSWRYEGIAWYGITDPDPSITHPVTVYRGMDFSPVYDYSFYRSAYPEVQKSCHDDAETLRYFVMVGLRNGQQGKQGVPADSSVYQTLYSQAHPGSQRIAELLRKSETAKKTDQIILVVDHSLSLWNKDAFGYWDMVQGEWYCGYGSHGLSVEHTEGDYRTPIGSFPALFAFGSAANPGSGMTWRQITPNSYWSAEMNGRYNTWVESASPIRGEHLSTIYQYEYAIATGFNTNPVKLGGGSAIFIHVKGRNSWNTAGCVSLSRDNMISLIRSCHDGAYCLFTANEGQIAAY